MSNFDLDHSTSNSFCLRPASLSISEILGGYLNLIPKVCGSSLMVTPSHKLICYAPLQAHIPPRTRPKSSNATVPHTDTHILQHARRGPFLTEVRHLTRPRQLQT